jgi:hypothetical protein
MITRRLSMSIVAALLLTACNVGAVSSCHSSAPEQQAAALDPGERTFRNDPEGAHRRVHSRRQRME